jgi:hypothetical protein
VIRRVTARTGDPDDGGQLTARTGDPDDGGQLTARTGDPDGGGEISLGLEGPRSFAQGRRPHSALISSAAWSGTKVCESRGART